VGVGDWDGDGVFWYGFWLGLVEGGECERKVRRESFHTRVDFERAESGRSLFEISAWLVELWRQVGGGLVGLSLFVEEEK